MAVNFEKDDSGIRVHERGVIAQLCAPFRSHEQGLPEWLKNSSAQYARENVATEHRVLTLLFGNQVADGLPYIAILDHGGMTVRDVEERFANWGDPEAHLGGVETDEVIEGSHGNGGKCYMTQMFGDKSYLHTVKGGRGTRYGFVGDDPHPGYFPSRAAGRGFPITRTADELRRALKELGVELAHLPDDVLSAVAARDGFTLVVGLSPKNFGAADSWKRLVADALIHHPQMSLTTEKNRIYVVHNGRPVEGFCPVQLPKIEPHEYAPEPRITVIPNELPDPETNELCQMYGAGAPSGKLVLRTSSVSMRRGKRGRHHIRYIAHGRPVGFLRMEDVSRSHWVDRMYGECELDGLSGYETNDRVRLATAPYTRALEEWVREQVFAYENEFKNRQRLEVSQDQRNRLQEINHVLDRWKNRFLDDANFFAGQVPGTTDQPSPPPPRPLPQNEATAVAVQSHYPKAGVGVWLRLPVVFRDATGKRVAPPAYEWRSSDWAVATVDSQGGAVTHTPGVVDLWVETVDGRLRSSPIQIQVIDTVEARIETATLETPAGRFHQLDVHVKDREGDIHDDVFMTWVQDDSSVVSVSRTGKVIGRKVGATAVYAMDEQCINSPGACHVTVLPAET